jgi:hypothetical protein
MKTIYGVMPTLSKAKSIDILAKNLNEAKKYATKHGYKIITIRNEFELNVKAIAIKYFNKWEETK